MTLHSTLLVQGCIVVTAYDFQPEAQLVPIGILAPALGELSVQVADQRATADALVDALDRYWTDNASRFALVERLVLNLDNGPENHSRRTQFIARLVEFVDSHRVNVRLAYYPPYHSKYNPVERCWAAVESILLPICAKYTGRAEPT